VLTCLLLCGLPRASKAQISSALRLLYSYTAKEVALVLKLKAMLKTLILSGIGVLLISCNVKPHRDVSKTFVGQRKYYSAIPDDPADDGTMNGVICGLEKTPNTDSTFVFHFWMGRDLIATAKNDSTLAGQNADITLKFVEGNGHLLVLHSDGHGLEFQKLN
jgi:hypothetical protein